MWQALIVALLVLPKFLDAPMQSMLVRNSSTGLARTADGVSKNVVFIYDSN